MSLLASLKDTNSKIKLLRDEDFIIPQDMCSIYKKVRHYSIKSSTNVNEMALAFAITTYNNVEQFERFLNLIYEPSNIYCVHIDAKANETVKQAVRSIADCFDNVFVSTRSEWVIYGGFSVLKADLNCLNDLLDLSELVKNGHQNLVNKRIVEWKYENYIAV
jgi:hypothetical protein